MRQKKDDGQLTRSALKGAASAALFGAFFLASPENIYISGSPIPTAFTM
jgi:hypothetical protein